MVGIEIALRTSTDFSFEHNNIKRKLNIHRARLSKFKESKLNGEMIFQDDSQKIYKFINGKRLYL